MTLNDKMTIILPYFAEFCSFRGQLRNKNLITDEI